MSEYSVEEVRARFEAWATKSGFFVTKDDQGAYESGYMMCAWSAYQSALQSVVHLLPSGGRGGVDVGMVSRAIYRYAIVADHKLEPEFCEELARVALEAALAQPTGQATTCAGCGMHKPTPLRIDAMGGYVCLTCIDEKLSSLLGEFGYPDAPPAQVAGVDAMKVLAKLARHADDCLSHNALATGHGNWHCDCGYDRYVLDGEPTDAAFAPTAEPVAQGATGYVPLTIVQTICNSLRQRGDYLSISAATQLERLSAQPHASPEHPAGRQGEVVALPMASAPRDGTMLRLLVRFTEHATEDAEEAWTIGANTRSGYADGRENWQFAGWCWSHDHFTEGKGTPVGWLPMLADVAAPVGVPDGWRELIEWCATTAGTEVNGNQLSAKAKQLLAAAPSAPQGVE